MWREEDVIVITTIVQEHNLLYNRLECFSYEELVNMIAKITDEFTEKYANTNWMKLDYYDEITNFTNKKVMENLLHSFGNISINQETERTEEEWNDFPVSTLQKDIQNWIKNTFNTIED